MALIVDSGAIYALYDADDAHHIAVRDTVERTAGPLIIPTVILAEVDYLCGNFWVSMPNCASFRMSLMALFCWNR